MSDSAHNPEAKFAWREFSRAEPPKRSATERIADFLEIYGPYDEATAREQAARCVQCPEPLCVQGCPLHSNIPEWLRLTAEGQFLEAATLLRDTSNFPEICAAVCPSDSKCEGVCILDGRVEPVSIGAIEQFLNSYAFSHGLEEGSVAPSNGRRIAVLGSGPGGLTCADELSRRGYQVTVFDSELIPGGLLVNGIPAFKLEKSAVRRRIEMLEKRGVEFRLEATVGADVAFADLQGEYDAFYLAFRSRQARVLNVPGSELPGVVQALPFVVDKNTTVPLDLEHIDVTGTRVVVIGGGNLAIDCARTAIRCGAASVACVYRRDEASMPCSSRDYRDAVDEGVRVEFQVSPVAVLAGENGRVSGLRLARTVPAESDETGRQAFVSVPGSELEMEADWVFTALGFDPLPLPHAAPYDAVATDGHGRIAIDEHFATSVPGVFAGGDMVRGPVQVLEAVRDARSAAREIDSYLASREA